jgi:uncharacterized protein YukE
MAKDLEQKISYIQEKLDDVASTVHKIDKEVALQKAAFDDHQKQDEGMYEELKRMNNILQENTESLREHMHRTELLEKVVKTIDDRLSPLEQEKIKKEAVDHYRKDKLFQIGKWLGIVATIVGIIAGIKGLK